MGGRVPPTNLHLPEDHGTGRKTGSSSDHHPKRHDCDPGALTDPESPSRMADKTDGTTSDSICRAAPKQQSHTPDSSGSQPGSSGCMHAAAAYSGDIPRPVFPMTFIQRSNLNRRKKPATTTTPPSTTITTTPTSPHQPRTRAQGRPQSRAAQPSPKQSQNPPYPPSGPPEHRSADQEQTRHTNQEGRLRSNVRRGSVSTHRSARPQPQAHQKGPEEAEQRQSHHRQEEQAVRVLRRHLIARQRSRPG